MTTPLFRALLIALYGPFPYDNDQELDTDPRINPLDELRRLQANQDLLARFRQQSDLSNAYQIGAILDTSTFNQRLAFCRELHYSQKLTLKYRKVYSLFKGLPESALTQFPLTINDIDRHSYNSIFALNKEFHALYYNLTDNPIDFSSFEGNVLEDLF